MPKLTFKCPLCGKELVEKYTSLIGDTKLIEYRCGHVFSRDLLHVDESTLDFTSCDGSGKVARDYQKQGVKFLLESGMTGIIGDQMRLGKTPQALLALKNSYKTHTPCLILVRSANLWQWIREYKVWCDALPNGIFPILGTDAWIPGGFSAYIISMDTFSVQARCTCKHRYHETQCKVKDCLCRIYQSAGNSIRDRLKQIPFKLIIADEVHSFKNVSSNRSQAITEFVTFLNTGEETLNLLFNCSRCSQDWVEQGKRKYDKRIGVNAISKSAKCPQCGQWCYVSQQHDMREQYEGDPAKADKIKKLLALAAPGSGTTVHEQSAAQAKADSLKSEMPQVKEKPQPCGLIMLSGTAIKNRAEEFFVPLNLADPERYNSLERFRKQWLDQDAKGQWTRIKPYLLASFKEQIKGVYLRREKEDVFTSLPPLNRTFTLVEPEKDTYAKLYNSVIDTMEERIAYKGDPSFLDFAVDLMELRRICGLMKLSWVTDYMETSLDEDESEGQKPLYAIGLHHETVREILYNKLGGAENCWKFSGAESLDRKNWLELNYTRIPQRIGILNMLAGGVGCDFHEIDNVIILERQWSSADEEQFEFRFYNPDLKIKNRSTNVEYIIAKGTLDEWWFDMVEEKRRIFGETISNSWSITQDNGSFKNLLERTIAGRI